MALRPCWLCQELVAVEEVRRSDEILAFSKITIARFLSERGVKDCDSYTSSKPVRNSCMCHVSKLDLLTSEADECLFKPEERIAQAVVPVKQEAVEVPVDMKCEQPHITETNVRLFPRIVVEKLTAEEVGLWTKTAYRSPCEEQRNSEGDRIAQDTIPDLTSEITEVPAESIACEEIGIDRSELPHSAFDDQAFRLSLAESSSFPLGCPGKDLCLGSQQPSKNIAQKGSSEANLGESPTLQIQAREENNVFPTKVRSDESSDSGKPSEDEEEFVIPKRRRRRDRKRYLKPEHLANLNKLSIPRSSFKVEDGFFKCQTCDFSSKGPFAVEKHVNEVHLKVQPYECYECKKCFGSKLGLKCHKKECHDDQKTLCFCCGKVFSSEAAWKRHRQHERLQQEGKLVECGQCGQMVINLKSHREGKHKRKKLRCPQCDEEFGSGFALRIHKVKEHRVNNSPSLTCQHCGSFHSSKMLLNRHLVKKHGMELPEGTVFNCPQCSRVFFDRMFLEDHLNYHNNEKPYDCPLCDYKTWGRVMLNQHTRKSHNLSARNARKGC